VDLTVADIDDVLLVGGQTRYPLVRNRVREFYGQDPKESVNPDEAVARGAARYAAGLDSFDNVILIDALPMSIGIGLPGGKFEKLIERDTRLPSETTYSIRTVRNNQPEVTILIFQGEDDRVAHNEPLGMLVLSGLPKGPKGSVVIDIKLRVTEECILELSASERHSGRQMESKFATKDTPEALRKRLGLAPNPTSDEIDKRTAELDRPKSVWRWLTGVFER
jgi:molecular chaperone DnaK